MKFRILANNLFRWFRVLRKRLRVMLQGWNNFPLNFGAPGSFGEARCSYWSFGEAPENFDNRFC